MFTRLATYSGRASIALGALVAVASVHAGSPLQDQRPRFRADVDVVRIDVIATDESGDFLDDLRIDEFILYEDGALRELIDLQLVDLRVDAGAAGATPGPDASVAVSPQAEVVAPDVPHAGSVPGPSNLGAMIFFIEVPRLGRGARRRFADAWTELAAATETYGAPKAVYVLDEYYILRQVMPMSAEPGAMRRAGPEIERLLVPVGTGVFAQTGDVEDWEAVRTIADGADALHTINVLIALTASSSFREGRKSIIWVSSGIAATAGYMILPRAIEQLEKLTRAANSANTSIYALDPTLVTERYLERRSSDISKRIGPADDFLNDPFDSRVERFNALRDSLRVTARSTGGIAYPFTTRVGEALEEIRKDVERYYLLTYARGPERDGDYRKVKVETTRPGVTIRARAGYTDYSPAQLALLRASSDLVLPEISDTPKLPFAAYGSWADDGSPRLQLALDLGSWVEGEFDSETDREFQLALSAVDTSGRIVDESYELVTWRAALDVGPRPSVYVHDWPLGYGSFDVRVALTDRATLRAAAGRKSVHFPDPGNGWRVSQPILLAPGAGGLPEAVVDPEHHEGPLLGVYFESWSDAEPQVNALLDGDVRRVLPVSVQKMSDGRFSVMVSLMLLDGGSQGVIRIEVVNPATEESRLLEIETAGNERAP